jgi:hypothetical protein
LARSIRACPNKKTSAGDTRSVRFIGICCCIGIRQIDGARSNFCLAMRASGIPRQKSVDSQNRFYACPVGRVVDAKVEADGDIHVALEDATGNNVGTVSAEIPVGPKWCEIRQAAGSFVGLRQTI